MNLRSLLRPLEKKSPPFHGLKLQKINSQTNESPSQLKRVRSQSFDDLPQSLHSKKSSTSRVMQEHSTFSIVSIENIKPAMVEEDVLLGSGDNEEDVDSLKIFKKES